MLKLYKQNLILLILPLLFASNTFSRGKDNYAFYYKLINQAELCIVDLEFHDAYSLYNQAFTSFEKRRLSDLHNASLCAILIGEYGQAKNWIGEMITKGVNINRLNTRYFKQLPEPIWAEIKQNSNSLRAIYLSRIDSSYIAVIDTLRNREQTYLINRRSQQSYDSLVYEHAKVLYALISERGVPRVAVYGRAPLPLDVIKHHFGLRNRLRFPDKNNIDLNAEPYKSMDYAQYNLEPLLRQAVFNGDLSPQFFASAMAHSELDPTRQLGAYTIYADLNSKTITHESASEEIIQQIDKYRKSLGLESIQDAVKKDILVALYYNQETFPFDEHIRRNKEIGYSKKVMESLDPNSKEFDSLASASIRVLTETRESFFKNNSFRVERKSDYDHLEIDNKFDLLKEFHFSQNSVQKMIISLIE